MVQAIINIGENEDRVLNIIKGKYGYKNKSEAVMHVIKEYEENFLEPEIKPEYVEKLRKIEKGKMIRFKNIDELRKLIEG